MDYHIEKFDANEKGFYDIALKIRRTVFIGEQNVPEDIEIDEFETESTYYLVFYDINPVATARYRKVNDSIKLERFAVLEEFRNKGVGAILMRRIMDDFEDEDYPIYLNSQEDVIGFYRKFGFRKVGKRFFEAGIPHFKMIAG